MSFEIGQHQELTALLCLTLGAFHALEPGHGKTAMLAHFLAEKSGKMRAVLMAFSTAISHALSIFIISILVHGLLHVAVQYSSTESIFRTLNLISGAILLGVGVVIGFKGWQKSKQHDAYMFLKVSHVGCGCGKTHPKEDTGNWKTVVIGFAVGLIPCPTALVALSSAISSRDFSRAVMVIALFSCGIFITLLTAGMIIVKFGRDIKQSFRMKRLLPYTHWFQSFLLVITGLWHIVR